MIVQPTPTSPRSPARRAVRLAGIVLPAVLLTAVVAAGVLGRPAEPAPTLPHAPPSAGPPASAMAARIPAPAVTVPDGQFPAVVAGLAVRTVEEARATLEPRSPAPIAIAGYLVSVRPTGTCTADMPPPDPLGPLCERIARLASTTRTTGEPGASSWPTGMRVRLPVGVRLPAAAIGSTATPVIIVGRATDPTDAPTAGARRPAFTADLVAWVAGDPADASLVVDDGIDPVPPARMLRNRHAAESLVTGWSGTVLVSAVVRAGTVALIDPVAARALRRTTAPDGVVWYARALETAYGSMRYPSGDVPPRVSWVILDDATGDALAWGAG